MATGFLIASLAVALAACGWVVWRARAERARGQELRAALDALAEDGTNLLTATLVSLEAHARRSPSSDLGVATDGARAASRLLDAAHAFAEDPERRVEHAEGCIRVAIALARSRGARVLVRGAGTEIGSHGSVEVTCRTLAALIENAWQKQSGDARRFVQLSLRPDHLELEGPFDPTAEAQRLESCGWTLQRIEGDASRWALRATGGTDVDGALHAPSAVRQPST